MHTNSQTLRRLCINSCYVFTELCRIVVPLLLWSAKWHYKWGTSSSSQGTVTQTPSHAHRNSSFISSGLKCFFSFSIILYNWMQKCCPVNGGWKRFCNNGGSWFHIHRHFNEKICKQCCFWIGGILRCRGMSDTFPFNNIWWVLQMVPLVLCMCALQ